ncbi:MAG: potassium transporter TrkG [Roseinatronobacter sp.]
MRARGTFILVVMVALTALAMLLPAAIGFSLREHRAARAFLYSAVLLASFAGLIHLASRGRKGRAERFSHPFYVLTAAYLMLPPIMAVPLTDAVPGLSLSRAWFEMISSFTTTGASVLDESAPLSVHLWRAVVAWAGGAFVLVYALAILAPMNLGGFEVLTTGATGPSPDGAFRVLDAGAREGSNGDLGAALRMVGATYAGITVLLWVGLSITGLPPLRGLILAMGTLSTSGIYAPGAQAVSPGFAAEVMIALVLFTALTRVIWIGPMGGQRTQWVRTELALALAVLAIVAVLATSLVPGGGVAALWAAFFTALSFLTTTGYVSGVAPDGGGLTLGQGGVMLLCMVAIGGGVATTAGGIKLMRVYALFWQVRHELSHLVHPSSVAGDGPAKRALRREGAFAAWLFVMIFLFSLTLGIALLTVLGQTLESALRLMLGALTTTGPLAQTGAAAMAVPDYAALGGAELSVLSAAMIVGRLDFLLLLSVFWPRR